MDTPKITQPGRTGDKARGSKNKNPHENPSSRDLLDALTESAFLIDTDGIFLEVNDTLTGRLGKKREELIGKSCFEFISGEFADSRIKLTRRAIEEKRPVRAADFEDGKYLDTNVCPIFGPDRSVERLVVFSKDITSWKRSEHELMLINRVAAILLTRDGSRMYSDILSILLEELESPFGYFGFVNPAGDLVCPSMTRDIWKQCRMPAKDIVFPQSSWSGLWGRSLKEKKFLVLNQPMNPPEGHVPLIRAMACPIIYESGYGGGGTGVLIGQIVLANKTSDYT